MANCAVLVPAAAVGAAGAPVKTGLAKLDLSANPVLSALVKDVSNAEICADNVAFNAELVVST